MINNLTENNKVQMSGIIVENPVFNHRLYGEDFFKLKISIKRLSDTYDILDVVFSSRLVQDMAEIKTGTNIHIIGEYRSHNNTHVVENKISFFIFAKELYVYKDASQIYYSDNITLRGFLCKEPTIRKTPLGRQISDLIVAVNRQYHKSDYIPCIVWGRNALFAQHLNIGDEILIKGRIQSREYQKKLESGEIVTRTAYEVSVSQIEEV